MISVDEAWEALLAIAPLGTVESLAVGDAAGRVLAEALSAKRTQPPGDVSAMDGYAVRFADIQSGHTQFEVIGEAPAGGRFDATVGEAQAVRIFTGGLVPHGCDHVIIQEDVAAETGDTPSIRLTDDQDAPRHIRKKGQDFVAGDVLLPAGHVMSPADLAVAANANHATLTVFARPRIAFVASGDEIVAAGAATEDTHIPDSNSAALAAMVHAWGGACVASIVTPDDVAAFTQAVETLPPADIIVPIGGASVGDYDFAKQVFYDLAYQPVFEKIAVKPGKPCWFAKRDDALVLGLPGNPSSAMVTAHLFLRPLIARLTGHSDAAPRMAAGRVAHDVEANGSRESFLRGHWRIDDTGRVELHLSSRQDSALTTTFAEANCLVRRPANAPALKTGAVVNYLPL